MSTQRIVGVVEQPDHEPISIEVGGTPAEAWIVCGAEGERVCTTKTPAASRKLAELLIRAAELQEAAVRSVRPKK